MDRRKAIGSIAMLGLAAGTVRGWGYLGSRSPVALQLLDTHAPLIAGLAETIIPVTDSPGAIDAGVAAFIVKTVREGTDRRSQRNFVAGLEQTVALCQARFGRPFAACSEPERAAVLRYWQEARPAGPWGRFRQGWFGRSFYDLLRTYTVIGYCTSELGARHALAYDFIPGPRFEGCLPLRPGQRAWATF